MSLLREIRLITALPMLGLMLTGGMLIFTDTKFLLKAVRTQAHVVEVIEIDALIHELQVERGLSAGYLASKGQNFKQELSAQRSVVDAAYANLPPIADDLRPYVDSALGMRGQIDSFGATVPNMAKAFTGAIRHALEANAGIKRTFEVPSVVQIAAGATTLGEAKEKAGLQRAAGAAGMGAGRFNSAQYTRFLTLQASENTLLAEAMVFMAGDLPQLDLMADLAQAEVTALREAIISAGPSVPIKDHTAPEWFAKSTAWIEHLRDVEVTAAEKMKDLANAAAFGAMRDLAIAAALLFGSVFISILLGTKFVRRTASRIENVVDEMGLIAQKRFDFTPQAVNDVSEIGDLSRSLNQTRLALQTADTKMRDDQTARETAIEKLRLSLVEMADRNLDCQISAKLNGDYEVLRQNFNRSIGQFSGAFIEVMEAFDGLNGRSAELKDAMSDMATRTESQASALLETATALDQITETFSETAGAANSANDKVLVLSRQAGEGTAQIQEAINAMEKITESSEQMSGAVALIEDIAFQTNLLALNAGVEAARAGETGKGFAVVASEVRALAVRATEATEEIKTLISGSKSTVETGVSMVTEAGKVFETIHDGVRASQGLVEKISTESASQADTISDIRSSMQSLDQMTQQNAAMVEECTALSASFSGDFGHLSTIVESFQLPGANFKAMKRA